MDADKIKEYYNFNADLWRFTRERLESVQNTDYWWDESFKQANTILKKHEQALNEGYIREAIGAVLHELSRLCKEKELKDGQASIVG